MAEIPKTNICCLDLTQQELLDIMIASYRLHPKKLKKPNTLHIVCKERDGFSLNAIFGVD